MSIVGFKTDSASSLDQSSIQRMTREIKESGMGGSSYEMEQDQKSSQRFRTVVKSLKDCEVFDTEEVGSDQEYDDDVIKEKEESSTTPRRQEPTSARDKMVEETDIGDLVSGVDIITDNITMDKAFEVFAKYEEEDIARPF